MRAWPLTVNASFSRVCGDPSASRHGPGMFARRILVPLFIAATASAQELSGPGAQELLHPLAASCRLPVARVGWFLPPRLPPAPRPSFLLNSPRCGCFPWCLFFRPTVRGPAAGRVRGSQRRLCPGAGDSRTAPSGDRPWSPTFRRTQTQTCPDASWQGSPVVADAGSLYHVSQSQTHAVRLTVAAGDSYGLNAFQFWCYNPGGSQNLGSASIALYNDLGGANAGVSTLIAGTEATIAGGLCSAGWNKAFLDVAYVTPIAAGYYWIVFAHENDWQTSYAPGTQLVKAGFALANDLTATGFTEYDAHSPSSSVPLAAQLCDQSTSRICMDDCGAAQPDWNDRTDSCFWLVRWAGDNCMSDCGAQTIADAARDLARCQAGYHGFSADLSADTHVQAITPGFLDVLPYETAGFGGRHALFDYGSGFDAVNGVYTANTAGLYLVLANVRLDGADTGDMVSAAIAINGATDAGNGMTVRQHNIASAVAATGTVGMWTLTVCGVVNLAVGNTINVAVSLPTDADFYVQHETGFHAVSLQTVAGFAAAFSAQATISAQAGVWQELVAFVPSGPGMFDQPTASGVSVFDQSTGRFTAPETGLYFASASIRVSGVADANTVRVKIAMNGAAGDTEGSGLSTLGADAPNSNGNRHDVVAGVLQLNQSDTLSVWINVDAGASFSVEPESSFTAVAMESPEGFEVQLVADMDVTNQGNSFVEVAGYRTADTNTESPSLFATTLSALGFSSGLNLATGRYTAAFAGVYFSHATVRFASANLGNYIRVAIALNGQANDAANGGLSAISGEIDDRTKDIDASGLLSLDVGDYFSVWVQIAGNERPNAQQLAGDDDYVVNRQTRFASVFITSPPRSMIACNEPPNADYNGDTCSQCLASGASCSRCANIFGFDCSCACIADECVEVANDAYGGDTCSDCLHSGASCDQCSNSFNFDCGCACNANDEWAFWRPDRCFEVDCGAHGFCHEGSCLCVDGYRGSSCIVPAGQGMLCKDSGGLELLESGLACSNPANERVISLGAVASEANCRTLCRTQAEAGVSVQAGCCQWNGGTGTTMGDCQYIPGATATAVDLSASASICALVGIQTGDDDYSLIQDDCTDIQPVTASLVEAVIKLHSQLQNRACVDGYFENEFGICEKLDPIVEPIVSINPQSCTGRNPSRRGEQIECVFLGTITTVAGPSAGMDGMLFDSSDAMVLLHPFATSSAGGVPLSSRDNPEGEWTLDTWIRTPLPAHGQWHTLARGATGDSQVLAAPDQQSTWQKTRYSASVGSLTTDPAVGQVTNWDEMGSKQVQGTPIPASNAQPLGQDYFTDLVQGPRLSLGTFSGSGGDAGAGLPNKFSDTSFDVSTLSAGAQLSASPLCPRAQWIVCVLQLNIPTRAGS